MVELTYQDIEENNEYKEIITLVLKECYKEEKLENSKLSVQVTLTTPQNIRKLNKEYRNIDKETDVLSFPMFDKKEIINIKKIEYEEVLGDIVISVERVENQAKEYGHSFERELAYMVVHGFYHLMGEDHIKEEDKEKMREKEEKVLSRLNIVRK